jgi:hypothetical protein
MLTNRAHTIPITRRRFLKYLGAGATVAAAGSWAAKLLAQSSAGDASPLSAKSRVVIVTSPKAVRHYEANAAEVARALERGMLALTGKSSPADAWRQFAAPTDIVGLKIAAAGGPSFSTHAALIAAVMDGLTAAGVAAGNIIVWDKSAQVMRSAKFPIESDSAAPPPNDRVRYLATVPHTGYDEAVFYETNLAGRLQWDDHEFGKTELGTRSYYSRIVTQKVTKLICLPVMTDSRDSGLAGSLYTMASGAVDNTRRFAGPPSYFDPAAAEICANPVLKNKWCLTIGDGLLAQYLGGPAFHPQYCWHHAALYLSADPVAVDALMLEQIETVRQHAALQPIGAHAQHIATAAAYGLSQADPTRIENVALQI